MWPQLVLRGGSGDWRNPARPFGSAPTRSPASSPARPRTRECRPSGRPGATCRDHGSCRPLPLDSQRGQYVPRSGQLYLYRQHSEQRSRPFGIDVCSVFARTPRYGPAGRGTHVTPARRSPGRGTRTSCRHSPGRSWPAPPCPHPIPPIMTCSPARRVGLLPSRSR